MSETESFIRFVHTTPMRGRQSVRWQRILFLGAIMSIFKRHRRSYIAIFPSKMQMNSVFATQSQAETFLLHFIVLMWRIMSAGACLQPV